MTTFVETSYQLIDHPTTMAQKSLRLSVAGCDRGFGCGLWELKWTKDDLKVCASAEGLPVAALGEIPTSSS